MSASVVSRGGVRFEFLPDTGSPNFQCKASMRSHSGHGPTLVAAVESLIADIERELEVARAALAVIREEAAR